MKSGDIGAYKWGESVRSDSTTLFDAVRNLRHHLIGLRAVNVSWDSGLLVPSDDEKRQGWTIQEGRAISPVIEDPIIDAWPWGDGGFEEWYFFSELPPQLNLSAYCNWVGLSIADWASLVNIPTGLNLLQQLETCRPTAVLGIGERLFAISPARSLIDDFEQAFGNVYIRLQPASGTKVVPTSDSVRAGPSCKSAHQAAMADADNASEHSVRIGPCRRTAAVGSGAVVVPAFNVR